MRGNYGENGTEYRTEVASQQRIISYGRAGTGPRYFTVEGVDGSLTYYGGQDISRSRDDAMTQADGTVLTSGHQYQR